MLLFSIYCQLVSAFKISFSRNERFALFLLSKNDQRTPDSEVTMQLDDYLYIGAKVKVIARGVGTLKNLSQQNSVSLESPSRRKEIPAQGTAGQDHAT